MAMTYDDIKFFAACLEAGVDSIKRKDLSVKMMGQVLAMVGWKYEARAGHHARWKTVAPKLTAPGGEVFEWAATRWASPTKAYAFIREHGGDVAVSEWLAANEPIITDSKVRSALLKLSRGSDLTITQIRLALEALGFEVVATKAENPRTGKMSKVYDITAPGGEVFEWRIEPSRAALAWYSWSRDSKDCLKTWVRSRLLEQVAMTDVPADEVFVEAACAALEIDTPRTAAAKKEAARKDAERLSTCPICFGAYKHRNGKMVLHGYQRPGWGFIHGRCPGVEKQCYEISAEATAEFLAATIVPVLSAAQVANVAAQAFDADEIVVREGDGYTDPHEGAREPTRRR